MRPRCSDDYYWRFALKLRSLLKMRNLGFYHMDCAVTHLCQKNKAHQLVLTSLVGLSRNCGPKKLRKFTAEQKAEIVRRHLKDKTPINTLAEELSLQPTQIYQWVALVLELACTTLKHLGPLTQLDHPPPALEPNLRPPRPRDRRQPLDEVLRRASLHHLGLVADQLVLVPREQREDLQTNDLFLFDDRSEQEPFCGLVVPRAEGEVPQAVDDGPPAVDLDGLPDVGVVPDDEVGPGVNRRAADLLLELGRWAVIPDPPMEHDHHEIGCLPRPSDHLRHGFPRGGDRAREGFRRLVLPHRAPVVAGKGARLPRGLKVAKTGLGREEPAKGDAKITDESDDRLVYLVEVLGGAERGQSRLSDVAQGLRHARAAGVPEVIVGQAHQVEARPCKPLQGPRWNLVRIPQPLDRLRLHRDRPLEAGDRQIRSGRERPRRRERVGDAVFLQEGPRVVPGHHVPDEYDRARARGDGEGRFRQLAVGIDLHGDLSGKRGGVRGVAVRAALAAGQEENQREKREEEAACSYREHGDNCTPAGANRCQAPFLSLSLGSVLKPCPPIFGMRQNPR
jgi:transposase-like protein